MDASKEYILMCEKAEEIQKKWDWDSDFCCLYNRIDKKCYCNVQLYVYCGKEKKNLEVDREIYVWLPRQDQLQEILGMINYKHVKGIILDFAYWCPTVTEEFRTHEQLWLAFVMYKKYNKIWNSAKGHECWAEDFREDKNGR